MATEIQLHTPFGDRCTGCPALQQCVGYVKRHRGSIIKEVIEKTDVFPRKKYLSPPPVKIDSLQIDIECPVVREPDGVNCKGIVTAKLVFPDGFHARNGDNTGLTSTGIIFRTRKPVLCQAIT